MTIAEKVLIVVLIALVSLGALAVVSSYFGKTTADRDAIAVAVVINAVKEASLYARDITKWTDFLSGQAWKHSACGSDNPTDCWRVSLSLTSPGTAVVEMLNSEDGTTLAVFETYIYRLPLPFAVSSAPHPLLTTITATSLTDYYTPQNGTDLANYIMYRRTR